MLPYTLGMVQTQSSVDFCTGYCLANEPLAFSLYANTCGYAGRQEGQNSSQRQRTHLLDSTAPLYSRCKCNVLHYRTSSSDASYTSTSPRSFSLDECIAQLALRQQQYFGTTTATVVSKLLSQVLLDIFLKITDHGAMSTSLSEEVISNVIGRVMCCADWLDWSIGLFRSSCFPTPPTDHKIPKFRHLIGASPAQELDQA